MMRRALAIVAALLVLLAVLALHALPAASDVPVVSGVVPAGEFTMIGAPSPVMTVRRSTRLGARDVISGRVPLRHGTAGSADQAGPEQLPQPGASSPATPTPRPAPAASPSLRAVPRLAARDSAGTPQRGQDSRPIGSVTGEASWFASPIGVSAAGPALRAALGAGWRGTRVTVCGPAGCAVTILGDWMRADRLVDLDVSVFPAVCGPLSLGLCRAEVTWP